MNTPDPLAILWLAAVSFVWIVSALAGRKHAKTNRRKHDNRKPLIRAL